MTPETTPAPAAQPAAPAPAPVTEESPFSSFQTDSYEGGQKVEEPSAPAPEPAPEPVETPEESSAEAEPPAPPKKQTAQERIDELTRARRTEERRRVEAEQEIERLRAQINPPKKEETPPAQPPATAGEPNPEEFDFGELDPRYIRALARYESSLVLQERDQQEKQTREQQTLQERHRQVQERFEEKVKVGAEKHADYHEVVVEGAQREEWAISPDLAQMAVESEVGEEILYHLATNPEESIRVYGLSPVQQARYFGKLEAQFSAAGPAATGETPKQDPPAKTPRAPAPILPARGAGGQFQATAATNDFAAFEAAMNGGK